MKKILTVLMVVSLNLFALKFNVSYHTFESASKPSSIQFIELDMIETKKTGSEVVNIMMVHVNQDGSVSDSITLFSFPISGWSNYPYGKIDRRFYLTMPETYPTGKFKITVSYSANEIFGYFMNPTVGINDELYSTGETPQYYDLNGKLLPEPKGVCIEVIGKQRKVIYKEK